MAQVTVYVPDALRDQAKAANLNLSAVLQAGIEMALDDYRIAAKFQRRQRPVEVHGVQEHTPGAALPAPSEPIVMDCTSVGVPAWPGGYKIRHVGKKKRLDFGSICDACNRKWER